MRAKLESLPCYKCNKEPVFVPYPTEEFPTHYLAECDCKGGPMVFYAYRAARRRLNSLEPPRRRASLNCFIRAWNKMVKRNQDIKLGKVANSAGIVCKFCGAKELVWGRNSVKSLWPNSREWVLYEFYEDASTSPVIFGPGNNTTITTKIHKLRMHRCLSKDKIVSVEYFKD